MVKIFFGIIYNSDDTNKKFFVLSREKINERIFFKKFALHGVRGVNFVRSISPNYFSYFRYSQINFLELNLEIISPHYTYYKFFNDKTLSKFCQLKKICLIANNSLLRRDCSCVENCFYNDVNCFSKINASKFALEVFIDMAFLKTKSQNPYGNKFFPRVLNFFIVKKCVIFNSGVRNWKKKECTVLFAYN